MFSHTFKMVRENQADVKANGISDRYDSSRIWKSKTRHGARHKSFMKKLRNKRRHRQERIQRRTEEYEDEKVLLPSEIDPKLEQKVFYALLNPTLEIPTQGTKLLEMSGTDFENLPNLLQKLYGQDLICLQSDGYTITFINLESISRLIEMKNLSLRQSNIPRFKTDSEEIEYLLNAPSVRDKETKRVGSEIQELLTAKSYQEQLIKQKFQSAGGSQLREFCPQKTREDCRRVSRSGRACPRLHFRRIIQSHTDESLGDCSFLNTCFHMESCKFVHYEIDQTQETESRKGGIKPRPSLQSLGSKLVPPQWLNCDLRNFDTSVLGKFAVVMADPPWDIHMELPYGTMSDDEMRQLDIPSLQDDGFIFLWVTGRAMELGRECLTLWGYERIDELVWVKTNQLQRLIRTGRTGHWINHGKEHCLVGAKGNLQGVNRGIDTDVIVAEVRATSRKPDEIYGVIERLSPGTRKIELFGRQHNCQPNWLTLGNQLEGDNLHDPELRERFYSRYPEKLHAYPAVT